MTDAQFVTMMKIFDEVYNNLEMLREYAIKLKTFILVSFLINMAVIFALAIMAVNK